MGFAQSMPETLGAKYYTEYSLNTFKQLPALHQKIANSKFNYKDMLVFHFMLTIYTSL